MQSGKLVMWGGLTNDKSTTQSRNMLAYKLKGLFDRVYLLREA